MPHNAVTIVTGAGSGIGRAVCLRLARAGQRLALVGRTEASLRETQRLIGDVADNRAETLVITADVAAPQAAHRIADPVLERWGRVDALVNNAGMAPLLPIEQTDHARLVETFQLNVFGPALLIAHLWPVFRTQGGGRIVNVASRAVVDPFPGFFMYAASKAAIDSFTRSIENEGAAAGICAFTVAPGAVETAMLRRAFSQEQVPPDQAADPDDVAAVIAECVLGRRDAERGTCIEIRRSAPASG